MENNGTSSAILARHDYLPFGEEIWAGVGLRTTVQKYAKTDKVRQRFALTERDEGTGLDHTWFRKYENTSGRWTSPDPYGGSIGDPQSFNRYAYVQNDPVNLVDPSGLAPQICFDISNGDGSTRVCFGEWQPFWGFVPKDREAVGPIGKEPQKPRTPYIDEKVLNDFAQKVNRPTVPRAKRSDAKTAAEVFPAKIAQLSFDIRSLRSRYCNDRRLNGLAQDFLCKAVLNRDGTLVT